MSVRERKKNGPQLRRTDEVNEEVYSGEEGKNPLHLGSVTKATREIPIVKTTDRHSPSPKKRWALTPKAKKKPRYETKRPSLSEILKKKKVWGDKNGRPTIRN